MEIDVSDSDHEILMCGTGARNPACRVYEVISFLWFEAILLSFLH